MDKQKTVMCVIFVRYGYICIFLQRAAVYAFTDQLVKHLAVAVNVPLFFAQLC